MCLAVPASHAMGGGDDVYVVSDAPGGVTPEAHDMASRRLVAAGAQPITWIGLAGELQREWARAEHLPAGSQFLIQHARAPGSVLPWGTQLLDAHKLTPRPKSATLHLAPPISPPPPTLLP